MKFKEIVESTTSGSVATVATPIGGTQVRGKGIYPNEKGGNLLKGKKTNAKFANSLSEDELAEQDLILVPGQGHRLKSGFVPHGASRIDHEVEMARSDLFQAVKNARAVHEILKDRSEDEGLEGWVQEKIIKANDYLNSVREYLEGKQMQEAGVIAAGGVGEGVEEEQSPFTNPSYDPLKAREYKAKMSKKHPGLYKGGAKQDHDDVMKWAKHKKPNLPEQGVAEGFEPGHREIERWATQSEENQKIYDAYIRAGKMADEAYKNKDGATASGMGLRKKQIRDLIAKKMQEQGVAEGAKVDRMVKHIAKSERELGKSKDKAEDIAWATVNKRGYLDNKNKKKGK